MHKLIRLLYTKFEYFKKHSNGLASQYDDIKEKYKAESDMKKHFLNKVRELESMYMSISAEVIQYKKDAVVSINSNIEFKEESRGDGRNKRKDRQRESDIKKDCNEES